MRRAKIYQEESGRWVVRRLGPGIDTSESWLTWGAAVASAVEWVDFR